MIPKSIRWRLPLTYAAIALLTVMALGTVLVTTLRAYYSEQEWQYLNDNAHVIGQGVTRMLRNDVPVDILRVQLDNFSFLSQSRVRLLDTEEQLVVESAVPDNFLISLAYSALPAPEPVWWEQNTDHIIIQAGVSTQENEAQQYVPLLGIRPEREFLFEERLQQDGAQFMPGDFFYSMAVAGTPFGFGFNRELSSPRSDQQVRVSLFDPQQKVLAFLELSDGPAYGTEIINGVLQAFVAAGVVAVLVAGGTGWYISRRITAPLLVLTEATSRMADGQLSARVQVEGRDEFGLLAGVFNQMAGKVEGTVTTLRRFVADAAHELHTPITALHANLELAATEENESQRITFIERAVEQLKRLEALTSSLLDLSRLESNSEQAERVPVDLVALVRTTSELYASRAEQAGHSFYFNLPESPVITCVNEGQLRRALGNLLDNAIKFTPADGVIGVGLKHHQTSIELWVKDTGIGIPSEELPHIFSRFHRARNTAAYPGSGLGLAIIKAIVEGHDGQVSVNSGEQGTCFIVQLPIPA